MASKKTRSSKTTRAAEKAIQATDARGTTAPGGLQQETNAQGAAGTRSKKAAKSRSQGNPAKGEHAKPKPTASQDKKLSALDAAAKVLQEAGTPLNCQDMIAAMAAKAYWSSPAGKTPASTLYSALLREIKIKGPQARFQKAARGQFVYQILQAS
jgi:HB1, ASXL, restriction endonuclease HTH domain